MDQTVVHTTAPTIAARMRVQDYLCACGLPQPIIDEWLPELEQESSDLATMLAAAQQRLNGWLSSTLEIADADQQGLLIAHAALPYWQGDGGHLSADARAAIAHCCFLATPQEHPLAMPIQKIILCTPGVQITNLFTNICHDCLPLGRRVLNWLRRV
ncbi:MAG: hypothetical protein HQL49_07400 [Gammaproteobacteria bacterium]|nr:hypothetical protein [Gammaproteobacteria bacterium]